MATAQPGSRTATVRRYLRRTAIGCGVLLALGQAVWAVRLIGSSERARSDQAAIRVQSTVVELVPGDPAAAAVAAPAADPGAGAAADPGTAPAAGSRGGGHLLDAVQGWAQTMSRRVAIPPVALAAYGAAEVRLRTERPGCHLSWVALAGIASVESDHGRFGGAVLTPDGRSRPPVIGVPLNGSGVARITDTDGGALDGDARHDRAVGPMQFIPTTWARWGADGNGDGRRDPFALPDAALAAGRYLCEVGDGDLRQGSAWTAALWGYNRSSSYAVEVTERSNAYATAAMR